MEIITVFWNDIIVNYAQILLLHQNEMADNNGVRLDKFLFLLVVVIAAFSATSYAEETPTYSLAPVMVQSTPESQEPVGPYNQPRWAARGRFSTDTDVYVLPPYLFYVDLDYEVTIPRHGNTDHLFTQEFELGLPYRFQIAFENNVEVFHNFTQVPFQTVEARYALADWGKIPLNPTLLAEYKFGIGKNFEGHEDADSPAPHVPDSFEVRVLLGEQVTRRLQWAMNIFHEQEIGGDREWETGFSQALSYAIRDDYLKTGLEMEFVRRSDAGTRAHPTNEFDIGPNFTLKPGKRTRLDLAALLGTTSQSPSAKIFAVFSFYFGKEEDSEASEPVSTKNR